MIRTQIYIPSQIHQTAKLLASKQKKPLAELLRQFIIQGIYKEKARKLNKNLSSLANLNLSGGPKDLSNKMDKYLYG